VGAHGTYASFGIWIALSRAIEVPMTPGVRFHHMITLALAYLGEISTSLMRGWRGFDAPALSSGR
jgi:hypothetical protein